MHTGHGGRSRLAVHEAELTEADAGQADVRDDRIDTIMVGDADLSGSVRQQHQAAKDIIGLRDNLMLFFPHSRAFSLSLFSSHLFVTMASKLLALDRTYG